VKRKENVWLLHRVAKAYAQTPYELLTDSYAAYSFNRAVYLFGNHVDNLLEQQEEYKDGDKIKYRAKYTLEKAIQKASENPNDPKEKFKGYAALFAGLG
jgi:CRISPR/Cas system-associated protein Cas10 (large subunit of type III CRISPR-Cas system)